ncbi:MAG: hypothetical protein ACLR8Y_02960 [Alistipes indistinctus]
MVASWAVYALEKLLKKSAVRITAGDWQVIAQGEADRAALAAEWRWMPAAISLR